MERHHAGCADDVSREFGERLLTHDEVDAVIGPAGTVQEFVDIRQNSFGKLFAEPDDAGAEEGRFAFGAVGQICCSKMRDLDTSVGDVEVFAFSLGLQLVIDFLSGFVRSRVHAFRRYSEGRDDGIGEVVRVTVVAAPVRALQLKQRAMQKLQLLGRMISSLTQAVDVLGQRHETRHFACELR